MKTAFADICKATGLEYLHVDFAENVTWAELYLASSMDLKVLPNLTSVRSADVSSTNPRSINIPSGLLKLESIRMALTRSGAGADEEPIYLQSTSISTTHSRSNIK